MLTTHFLKHAVNTFIDSESYSTSVLWRTAILNVFYLNTWN
jgi:hypothetical protein